jgi:uncharacterized phiE125 gp8 family phage protein
MYQIPQNKALGSNQMLDYYVKQTADVDTEPLTLADVESHSRIDLGSPVDTEEQTYIESLFSAARKAVEGIIQKPIGEQEFELGLARWPSGWIIELPRFPLIAVKTIKYKPLDADEITWYDSTASPAIDPGFFSIETGSEPGAIFLSPTKAWPFEVLGNGFPIKIRFTAGYATIPTDLYQAIRFMFAHFYETREPVTDGRINQPFEVPKTADWLCADYKYDGLF